MAVSTNWDPFCGCPCNKSSTIWGEYEVPDFLETPILRALPYELQSKVPHSELASMFLLRHRTRILCSGRIL